MSERRNYESLTEEYQKLQDGKLPFVLSTSSPPYQTLTSVKTSAQPSKHANALKEFATLDDTANIYKLSGPVLLKQDTAEAKSTVESRLQYIEGEIKRVEGNIKDIQERSEAKKTQILQAQSQMQQEQQQGATAAPA